MKVSIAFWLPLSEYRKQGFLSFNFAANNTVSPFFSGLQEEASTSRSTDFKMKNEGKVVFRKKSLLPIFGKLIFYALTLMRWVLAIRGAHYSRSLKKFLRENVEASQSLWKFLFSSSLRISFFFTETLWKGFHDFHPNIENILHNF